MAINLEWILPLLLTQFVYSYHQPIQLANKIDYNIKIDVINHNEYGLAGMVVNVKYNGQVIINNEYTDAKGQFIKQGKWDQSSNENYNIDVVVTTQYNQNIQQQKSFSGKAQNGVVTIIGSIKFPDSDFQTSDPQQKCQITVKTLQAENAQQLPEVGIDFTIVYNDNSAQKQIKFSGVSNQNGLLQTSFWIPSIARVAVVLYESHKYGYWNDFQKDIANSNFILSINKEYQFSFDTKLYTGVYKYIISGVLLDEKTNKGLEGVEVIFGGLNQIINQQINKKTLLSQANGQFQIEQDLPIYEKYNLELTLKKSKYLQQIMQFPLVIDLEKKEINQSTKDLKNIIMIQVLGTLTVKGVISDLTKVVNYITDATITLQFGQNSTPHEAKTDAKGEYKIELHTPIDEKISIQIKVQAKGFVEKLSEKKEIVVKENVPATLQINVELDRIRVPITIDDKIVDAQTNKVLPKTSVSIISSDPQIKGSTYYNKQYNDDANGLVQLKFECYQNVNFKATLEYKLDLYLPYKYTTNSLECKNQNLGVTSVKLEKIKVDLNIKGEVKDINSKPYKDFQLSLSSDPQMQFPNEKVKTGNDGIWILNQIKIIPQTTYQISATYVNVIKENVVTTYKYVATVEKIQNIQFTTIFAQALIKATISGTITTPEGPIPFPLPIQIKCDSKGKDGKPISIQTKSGSDGKFTQQVEMVGSSNVEDVCHVASGITQSVKPFDQQVKVGSPKWAVDSKVSATYNSFDITISGKVTDKSGISKSMEGVDITLTITPMDPLIPAQKTHVLELFLRKQQFLDQKTSQLSTKSSKDGAYKLIFKVVQGIELTGELTASLSGFDKFDKKGIKIAATKSETITQDIELNRALFQANLHSTLLDQNKHPIPKATITLIKTNPLIKDSPSYMKSVKDDDSGKFVIQFNCFQDQEYVAMFKIDVPTYVEESADSSKFKCSQKDIQLSPLSIKLEKVMLMAIVSGKVLNPFGKGQSNLDLKFITKPDSAQLQAKTTADGTWTINDPKIVPNQQYEADVTYTDYKKQQQEVDQKFEIQSANQKITFKDIMYSDTVKAKIEGTIKLEKGTISSPVTMELLCPKTSNQLKETKLEFKSDKTGKISESFDIVATFKEIIKCQLTPKDVIEPKPVNVELQQPKYEVQIQIQGKLQSQKVTISGILKDHTKISSALPNVPITLTLKPVDQLADSIQTKSGQDSKYKLEFEIAKGQEYDATLTVDYPPQFKKNDQTFKISGKTDLIAITKDVDLERIILNPNVHVTLNDDQSKPLAAPQVSVAKLVPQVIGHESDKISAKGDSKGQVGLKFYCYKGVEETMVLEVEIPKYKKTKSNEIKFKCDNNDITIPPVKVTMEKENSGTILTIKGMVINPDGKGQQKVKISLTTTPSTEELSATTDAEGKYTIKSDNKIHLKTKYTLHFQFENADGSKNVVQQEFQTDQETSSLEMKDMLYADFRGITIKGVIESEDGLPASQTKVLAISSAVSKDKNSLKTSIESDSQGEFKLQFDLLCQYKTVTKVLLENEESGKYYQSKVDLDIIPPKYEYDDQKIVIKLTKQYKDYLENYNVLLIVKGQLLGQFECNKEKQILGIEGVKIKLKQWNGVQFNDMNVETKSDKDGSYRMVTYILKSKLENQLELEFVKENYMSKFIYFNAEGFEHETSVKIVAYIPPTDLTYLSGLAPCPTKK